MRQRTPWLFAALLLVNGCTAMPPPSPGTPAPPPLAWSGGAAAPTPRTEVAAAALGDLVYVLGGFDARGGNRALMEEYDPHADTWSRAPDYPVPVHHVAFVSDGRSLIGLGGYATEAFAPSNLAFRWSPGQPGWTALAPLPIARAAGAAAVVDQRVYLLGGFGPGLPDGLVLLRQVDVLDLGTGRWSKAPDLPTPRDHLAAVTLGDRVWAIGGERGGHDRNVATVEAFDPATQTWSAAAPLPRPRGSLSAAVFQGRIVAVGGQDLEATYADVDAYDPAMGAWGPLAPLPTPRHGLGVAVAGGALHALLGGPRPGLSVTGVVERLAPLSGS